MTDDTCRSTIVSSDEWDARLQSLPNAAVLQTSEWGQLKSCFGWEAAQVRSDGGMALVLFRPTPLGRLAYVPLGPAFASVEELAGLLQEVHRVCRSRGAFVLKVEPNLPDDHPAADMTRFGFRPAFQTVQPRSTAVVDLAGSDDEVLARMRSKTRYNVRLAGRRGVRVRPGDESDLEAFAELIDETGRRDGFGVHPPEYYRRAYELFVPTGMATLWVAEYEGEPLAAVMVFAFAGVASYLYGASSDRHRNLMPNYALQWQAMRWAREKGCHTYDLWGIPDEVGIDPEAYLETDVPARTGLWGVWRFKRGFGVRVVRRAGAWDYVYRPIAYQAYRWGYRLRGGFGG